MEVGAEDGAGPRPARLRWQPKLLSSAVAVALWSSGSGGADGAPIHGAAAAGVARARGTNDFCWGDLAFPASPEACCLRGGCFAQDTLTDDGKVLAGHMFGVFSRSKCCSRPANVSSFYGFVNPYLQVVSNVKDKSVLMQFMDQTAVRLPAAARGSRPETMWSFVHTDGEVPAQLAWELRHFQAHEAQFRETYEARRKLYRRGHLPCAEQMEVFGSAAIDMSEMMSRLGDGLGWSRKREPRFVNIGANDGLNEDPLGTILKSLPHAWAVAAEMDPKLCAAHRRNLPHVHLWCDMVTPANAWDMLDAWVPAQVSEEWAAAVDSSGVREFPVDVLKIDIDSYDCAVVESLLVGLPSSRGMARIRLQPSVIVMEVNDGIPPPVQMALQYNPKLAMNLERPACMGNIPVAGCSLSHQVNMLGAFGYRLVLYTTGNAIFAHDAALPDLARVGVRGPVDEFECYWHTPVGAQCVAGRQVRRWFHEDGMGVWDVVSDIWQHLKAMESHFGLPQLPVSLKV